MTTRSWILAATGAFGLALFGFGKLVEAPDRRPSVPAAHAGAGAAPAPADPDWRLWDPPAAPEPAAHPGVWSTPAEWAPSD